MSECPMSDFTATSWACLRRRPKQQRSRDRVGLILDAAASILTSDGPSGTTITAVAAHTGLATSSIYDYVVGDRELIGAVAERGLARIYLELVEIVGTPQSVAELIESLSAGLQMYVRRYRDEPGLQQALAFADADPTLAMVNLTDTRRNAKVFERALAPLRPGVELRHTALLVTHFGGAFAGLVSLVDDEEAEALTAEFERLLLRILA